MNNIVLTSRSNPDIKLYRRLLTDTAYRKSSGLFAVEGARLCHDAALSNISINTLMYTENAEEKYKRQMQDIIPLCQKQLQIDAELALYLGSTVNPQGIFCICCAGQNISALDNSREIDKILRINPAKLIALENVRDPANIGAVIRTAEAFALDGIIMSAECADIYNPKVLRASMGGAFRIRIFTSADLPAAIKLLESMGVKSYACVIDEEAVPVGRQPFEGSCVCVIGNEGAGLTQQTADACGCKLTIPMRGRAQSLNAAMAAGIIMWEMTAKG